MSINIVNVVVPLSGDGPPASIGGLVGEKTVELSGRFVGRYILLGSQNDFDYVPVAIFDANGEESIKQTLVIIGNSTLPITKFHVATTSTDLVDFDVAAMVSALDSSMYLLYKNTLGTVVFNKVQVRAGTGDLYVTP